MRKTLLALSLAATAFAGMASAQTPPPARFPGGMMHADTNSDGVITRAEAVAQAGVMFDRQDGNHNGVVTGEERMAAREAMRGPRGDAPPPPPAGRGTDRSMSRADALAHAGGRFDRMDTNHDGKLDRTELANVREMRRERRDGDMPPAAPLAPPAGQR